MKTTIKTGLTAILLLIISCTKENDITQCSLITDETSTADVITDITGKYSSIKIGTQSWMTKNLEVSRYRNGDRIPQVKGPAEWAALTTGAWCWYNNDHGFAGKLYNWYAVNDPRGLAPAGWHVPSDAEWDTLSTYLGKNAGGKLKDTGTIEAGTGLWYAPNTGATNKTGFTGLPGGYRGQNGNFNTLGKYGLWWSSTESYTTTAWYSELTFDGGGIYRDGGFYKFEGFSVRCIKD